MDQPATQVLTVTNPSYAEYLAKHNPALLTQGFAPTKDYPPPQFLQTKGSPESVRTPGGHYRTESLFLELWKPIASARPIYSLLREDREDPKVPGRTIWSFQKVYVDMGDITGYKPAMAMLGSWKHWEKLRNLAWFKPHVEAWNNEIVAEMNARGFSAIVKAADRGDLKAAEYLINYTTGGVAKPTRGRPTKADVAKAARQIAEADSDLAEDEARILEGTTNG